MTAAPHIAVERVSTPEQLAEAFALRLVVFVEEQGVPPWEEVDDADFTDTTTHVIARDLDGGDVVGTARLLTDPAHLGEVHIGRVAVAQAARGSRVGAALMAALEAIAVAEHHDQYGNVTVLLSAQIQALGFYERLGYMPSGRIYLDAGIEHRDAAKILSHPAL
ncbi:MAG: GNAT family N-acetyltransferase [Cellulomonadaceae bacterium]|jgi:predicted GNAT family N-acyltransferase|nr:GNAT family N-acetyltransferase [Cellulomonadaceae bacterium]